MHAPRGHPSRVHSAQHECIAKILFCVRFFHLLVFFFFYGSCAAGARVRPTMHILYALERSKVERVLLANCTVRIVSLYRG